MKQYLTTKLALVQPDCNIQFYIVTDASLVAVAGYFGQGEIEKMKFCNILVED